MSRLHQNSFATNCTSGTTAGDTTSPLNSIPTIAAPFYLAFDATNINGNYEVVDCTSKTATNVNHAATTKSHTTAEEVRMILPAAEMDTWSAALDTTTWAAWTPTFANFTKGSATITAKYTQIGKTVFARIHVVLAADSSMGTNPTFSLPVASISYPNTAGVNMIGQLKILDSVTRWFFGGVDWVTTTTALLTFWTVGGTTIDQGAISATTPMTWTTSDEFSTQIMYEAAA